MKTTNKTNETLKFLSESFSQNDYKNYLEGLLSYSDLCKKYNCTDYLMSVFFKKNSLEKRRKKIKDAINEHIFDEISSKEVAYLFGFYMADGCIDKNNIFKISISSNDDGLLVKLKDLISPGSKIRYRKLYINPKTGIKTNPMCEFSFKSNHIACILNSYNCGYNKTYIDNSIIDIVPKNFMWDFIRGYFDGDGCISSSIVVKHHISTSGGVKNYTHENVLFKITSKTPTIIKELQEFFMNEGINVSIQEPKNTFELFTCSKKELIKIFNKLYNSSLYMQRKFDKFKHIIDNTEVILENKSSKTP